jgi:SAM-dependent methyltransferase
MIDALSKTSTADVESCPACQHRAYSEVGGAPGLTCSFGQLDFVQPDFVICECSACGLLYRTPNLASHELSAYYAAVDYRKWEHNAFFPTERAVLKRLRQLPRSARLLDFGCSSGRLLAPLTSVYDCCGFEINKEAALVAATKGLRMIPPEALDEGKAEGFDAIVMSDVFEHLSAPTVLLRKLVRILNPGGRLFIVTGNADAPVCRVAPAEFWYFRNVEHLCMFSRRHADYLCQELDVTLLEWCELSHYDTPKNNHIFQWARHSAYWHFRRKSWLSRAILPFVPGWRRARCWPVAPTYTASADHVLAVFKKDECKTFPGDLLRDGFQKSRFRP